GKTYDPPVNGNAKTTIIHDDSEDEADEAKKEVESSSSKQTKSDLSPLKEYKPKIPYPQCLGKEKIKMDKIYAAFLNEECSFIVQDKLPPKIVMEEELDALLNDYEPFSKEEFEDNFEELPLEEKLRIKTSIQELPTDLERNPLPDHLECTFLEKDSLLPVVISAPLKDNEKKRLVAGW
ncbi:hypothetical protein Tco_1536278, partial [Tanacetum coccineum]